MVSEIIEHLLLTHRRPVQREPARLRCLVTVRTTRVRFRVITGACVVPGSFSASAPQGLIEAYRANVSPALVRVAATSLLCPVLPSSEAVSETERAGWVALGKVTFQVFLNFQRARHSFLPDQGSETPGGAP